ncbi:MAG: dUTP diphosphatase [Myxococcales bacterium]
MADGPTLRIFRVRPSAVVPRYATHGAAGLDLSADLDAPVVIEPLGRARIPTGLILALPKGHEGQVRPRSGLAAKHGITVLNAPGTIDEDYRGELAVLLVNLSNTPFTIAHGERIAQLVVAPVVQVDLETCVDLAELGETVRGGGGFGSTGR